MLLRPEELGEESSVTVLPVQDDSVSPTLMPLADIPESLLEFAEAPTIGGLLAQAFQGPLDRDDLTLGMPAAGNHGRPYLRQPDEPFAPPQGRTLLHDPVAQIMLGDHVVRRPFGACLSPCALVLTGQLLSSRMLPEFRYRQGYKYTV